MKILVRGDIHLGLVSDGVSRLPEQRRILDHTIEVLNDVNPDVFVDLGDLFDKPRPGPEAIHAALGYFWKISRWTRDDPARRRAFVLSGNHDKPTRSSINALTPFVVLRENDPAFPVVVRDPRWFDGPVTLLTLPFVTDWEARLNGFEDAQTWLDEQTGLTFERTAGPIVAFTHLEVPGARYADDDRTQRDVGTRIPAALLESDRIVRVYAGHVHRYQALEKVTVVGSALHVDFGEAADRKGMIVAEV